MRISVTIHGDDYTSTGTERNLKWFEEELRRNFEIKTELLGPNRTRHQEEIRVLNRVLGWTEAGLTFEADQRLEMTSARPAWSPSMMPGPSRTRTKMVRHDRC